LSAESSAAIHFQIVIPARLGSTRLPRKVLRHLAGKPLVQWTWEAAMRAGAQQVVLATDEREVFEVCRSFGAEVRMTSAAHQSGTDRVNEIAAAMNWPGDAIVVNLQGDEPLMPAALVRNVADLLAQNQHADIATLAHPLHLREDWLNPNFVKVVMDAQNYALYFSRAPIPWKREGSSRESPLPVGLAFRHIGLYAYRVRALRRMAQLPPAALEQAEALEQLRALAHGLKIKLGITYEPPPRGVDTEDDFVAVAAMLEAAKTPR
jgi:3-deoxy-manno-octulosonate cytidylyltransferase (CMP-KDO synthetase)